MPDGSLACWWWIRPRWNPHTGKKPVPRNCGARAEWYWVNGWMKMSLCKKHLLCTLNRKGVVITDENGVQIRLQATGQGGVALSTEMPDVQGEQLC